eukprot:10294923-Ditylum_brightwellii.AAC.1
MEWCRSVQDRSRAVCNIFTRHYGAPCRAIANGYRILRLPTALHVILSTPSFRGYSIHRVPPPSGGMSTLPMSSTPHLGDTSILSTQTYQGGRIVYVMCNPTALV